MIEDAGSRIKRDLEQIISMESRKDPNIIKMPEYVYTMGRWLAWKQEFEEKTLFDRISGIEPDYEGELSTKDKIRGIKYALENTYLGDIPFLNGLGDIVVYFGLKLKKDLKELFKSIRNKIKLKEPEYYYIDGVRYENIGARHKHGRPLPDLTQFYNLVVDCFFYILRHSKVNMNININQDNIGDILKDPAKIFGFYRARLKLDFPILKQDLGKSTHLSPELNLRFMFEYEGINSLDNEKDYRKDKFINKYPNLNLINRYLYPEGRGRVVFSFELEYRF